MSALVRRNVPWWQQGSYVVLVAMVAVPFTALAVLMGVTAIQLDYSAYHSSAVCESTSNVSDCRFHGSARVVRTWSDKNGSRAVEVAFDQLGGLKVSGYLQANSPSQWQRWQPGDELTAELWHGKLSVIDGVKTGWNPDVIAPNVYPWVWIVGAIAIALDSLAVLWTVVWRRASKARGAQHAEEDLEHPATIERLPLTPEMTAFLQQEIAIARNPVRLGLILLACAAVLPAIFTASMASQGRLGEPWVPISWAVFLGGGALVIWWILNTVKLEKRALTGGVFLRAAGVFRVVVFRGKGGTSTTVTVGPYSASGGLPDALDGVDSGLGSMDYIPHCGELLVVRDASGQILWSRPAPVAAASSQSAAR